MDFLLMLALGAGGYFFYRHINRRGCNTVRAYLYLRAIADGASVEEANERSTEEVERSPAAVLAAKAFVQHAYGGKQLPMIAEAKRLGLVLSRSDHVAAQIENISSGASSVLDWVRPFILYYVASEMRLVGEGDLPETVRALATGRMTSGTQQSVLIALQNYLSFAYGRDRQWDEMPAAMSAGRDFLQAELRTLNSSAALKRFIRRMHKAETQSDISEAELEAQYSKIATEMKADDEFGFSMRNSMLKDSVEELFAIKHGETISSYSPRIDAHVEHLMR